MLFDTHAHYDDESYENEDIIANLPKNGVSLVINSGCGIERSIKSINLAKKYSHVYCTVGVHPHLAHEMTESDISTLKELAKYEKVVAIGEIGLDYFYKELNRDIQKEKFIAQMKLAEELNLPVVIHDRDAHEDCMKIIRMFPNVRGVFHCYAGSTEMAHELISLGYYLSFTGVVTFKNAKTAVDVVKNIDLKHILIETDSPYLTPEPHRGTQNSSLYVNLIAEKIAEIKGISFDEVASATYNNAINIFGMKV